jgi:hypothetical protein
VSDYGWEDFYAYDYYYAYYRAAAYPPIDAPSGTVDDPILIDAGAGEWAYIWFQFRAVQKFKRVNEMIIVATEAGQQDPTQDLSLTYYVQNDLWGDSAVKRWGGDATPPDYPEWHMNPAHFLDLPTGLGLPNELDNPEHMFHRQAADGNLWTGVALVGALTGEPSEAVYELKIDDIGYNAPPYPPIGESCFFRIVPEPGGVFLLGTVVLALRGRRP